MSEEVLDSAEVEDLQAEDEELAGDVTDPESDAESESQGEDPDYTGEAEDEEEDEVEGEEGVTDIFRHTVKYRANDRDEELHIDYDEDGNITEESMTRLRDMAAKTVGLEARTQTAVERSKQLEREVAAERIKTQQERTRSTKLREALDKYNRTAAVSPQRAAQLQRLGVQLPQQVDYKSIDQEVELESAKLARAQEAAVEFGRYVDSEFSRRHPELTPDQLALVADEMRPSLRTLPRSDSYDDLRDPFLGLAEKTYKALIVDGKLPDPRIAEAEQKVQSANERVKKANARLKKARKRRAVTSPVAGGGSQPSKGKEETFDFATATREEAAAFLAQQQRKQRGE